MHRLTKIGEIRPKTAKEVKSSRIGIGFEKLDRNVFQPEGCYGFLESLGAKWVRIQSGWARTESEKGVYRFEWLDEIVDSLLEHGLIPWMCLCYGNELYDKTTCNKTGAVGCPPVLTEEAKAAWDRYVRATAEHYRGRVKYYEVWNEPDGPWCWKHGPSGTEYGEYVVRTGKVIRTADPSAKILAGATCMRELDFLCDALEAGMGDWIDDVTYHNYSTDIENGVTEVMLARRALINRFNPAIGIIQGESGAPSDWRGRGAYHFCYWTEDIQAKVIARRLLLDLTTEVKFSSIFSLVDMYEDLSGLDTVRHKENYGFFGLMREKFDGAVPTGEYEPKPSYKAMQTICSLTADDAQSAELPVMFITLPSPGWDGKDTEAYRSYDTTRVRTSAFKKNNGSYAFSYWMASSVLQSTVRSTVSLLCMKMPRDVKLVDAVTGHVYKIPESMIVPKGEHSFRLENLPLTDSPLMVTFGDFADIDETV